MNTEPEILNPEQPVDSTDDQSNSDPSFKHGRTGKVARLPKTLRDQVNQMLLDNVPFARIIEGLRGALGARRQGDSLPQIAARKRCKFCMGPCRGAMAARREFTYNSGLAPDE